MKDSESLIVDLIDVCSLFFQKEGKVIVGSKDGIMQTREALIVLSGKPFPFGFESESIRILFDEFVVESKEMLTQLEVIVMGSKMEESTVIGIGDDLYILYKILADVPGSPDPDNSYIYVPINPPLDPDAYITQAQVP